MTTTPTPPATPAPKSGMPKWLIILLVVGLIIIVGCCGGATACYYLVARPAATSVQSTIQKNLDELDTKIKAAEEEERRRRAATNTETTPPSPTDTESPPTPTPTTRMPANFPSDVPVYKGLAPTFSTADKTRGSGSVMLSGKFDRAAVSSFYEKELEKAGWKQDSNMDVGEITQQQYSKDDRKLIVQINPGDGTDSSVMIIYEKK